MKHMSFVYISSHCCRRREMILRNFCHRLKWRYLSVGVKTHRHYSQRKILFFGTDNFSLPSLQLIAKENDVHSRLEVVTSFKAKRNQVKEFAMEHQLRLHDWKCVKNNPELCRNFDIGLVVSFGHLLPESIISSFSLGMLNVHASLLPKYRGASPIIYAIKNHETATGVSIMKIEPRKFDVGDVLASEEVPIPDDILMPELHDKLAHVGARLLVECLKKLDSCTPIKQDESLASYAPKTDKDFCKVRWSEMSAQQVYDLYRALYSYKHLLTSFRSEPVKILEMGMRNEEARLPAAGSIKFCWRSKKLLVRCGGAADDSCIEISKLIVGKKTLTPSDFKNGFLINLPEEERKFE